MPRCAALLTNGNQCRRESEGDAVNCVICQRKIDQREANAGPILPGGCCRIKTNGARCDRVAEENSTICLTHRQYDTRRERDRRNAQALQEQVDQRLAHITANRDAVPWIDALQMLHLELRGGTIHRQLFTRIETRISFIYRNAEHIGNFNGFNIALYNARILPVEMDDLEREQFLQRYLHTAAPPPIGELGVLAGDRQNVHTRFVSKQTNEGLEKILKMEIPPDQNTRKVIARAWMAIYALKDAYWKTFLDILTDINIWYETESCRDTGDRLYRRVLDGTWALIQTYDTEKRLSLLKRLYEECRDSYQMCSEGHISRLINVFSGFDDAFKPEQTLEEKLQEAMSGISLKSISLAEKQILAKDLFQKLNVPQEMQSAWIDAL
jgi:hypothetical protein